MSKFNADKILLNENNPWKQNENDIWLASLINLSRNLQKFDFPDKLSEGKKSQIVSLVSSKFEDCPALKGVQVFEAEDIFPIDKELLLEHFLSQQGFLQTSKGEAFVVDETCKFLATINLNNHLEFHSVNLQHDLEKSWENLCKVEEHFSLFSYAFNSRFGFLSTDPATCGTGLVVQIYMHLPALMYTHKFSEVATFNQEEGIEFTGLQGDPTELIGDIVVFKNSYTLGLTEEMILSNMRSLSQRLIKAESAARQNLADNKLNIADETKDKVSRAFGVLMHSYQIEAVEALEAISLLKLGLALNWLTGITSRELNSLLFYVRRAHLLYCERQEKVQQEELLHKRAQFIHKALANCELLI